MDTLIRIGAFPDALQAVIDREFWAISPDEALRSSVRGIITRSNCQVSADLNPASIPSRSAAGIRKQD